MISTILGIIRAIDAQTIVLQQAGIGFELVVPAPQLYKVDQQVELQIYMHWSQENGPTLYGFDTNLQKIVFLLIISCSGIGPKIGLAVLNKLDPATFLQAIVQDDTKALSSIGGIGPKKAEQIIVALKHKVSKLLQDMPEIAAASVSLANWKDLTDTLISLGYSSSEIKSAVNFLQASNLDGATPLTTVLRKTLAFLATK